MFGLFGKTSRAPTPSAPAHRLSYEDSCRRLQPGLLEFGEVPPPPAQMPRADGEDDGVRFFRTLVDGATDLSNLTLPRTFFGRSEINATNFQNTDLSESNLCWNDFIDVIFTGASLVRSDLRASSFTRVRFDLADLSNADLRQSSFADCMFTGAKMSGAILTSMQGRQLNLSKAQRAEVSWAGDDGPEPAGG